MVDFLKKFVNYFLSLFIVPLTSSSPGIRTALEIGRKGELYIFERNFQDALESFKSALGQLVLLLTTEPPGNRRTMMHQLTQFWMQEAESLKAILSAEAWKKTTEEEEAEGQSENAMNNKLAINSHCSLQ